MKKFIRIFAGVFLVTVFGTVSVFADQNDVVPTVAFRDDGGSHQQPSAESKAEAEAKYIKSQIANIKIGSRIAFEEALYSKAKTTNLVAAVAGWQAACVAILTNQQIMGAENIQAVKSHEGGKIVYTCEITKCYENSFDLSADKKTCVKKNTDTTKLDNKPIVPINTGDSSIVSSKAHEILMIANDSVTGIVGSQIIFTDDEATNKDIASAVETWKKKCKIGGDYPIDSTIVNEKKSKKTTTLTCFVESCESDEIDTYVVSSDKKACVKRGSECKPTDKNAATGWFDTDKKECKVASCKDGFMVQDGKCVSIDKINRKNEKAKNKAQKAVDKEYKSDIEQLTKEFKKVIQKLTKECEKSGGKVVDGVCKK